MLLGLCDTASPGSLLFSNPPVYSLHLSHNSCSSFHTMTQLRGFPSCILAYNAILTLISKRLWLKPTNHKPEEMI